MIIHQPALPHRGHSCQKGCLRLQNANRRCVTLMGYERRVAKVGEQLKREISQMLVHDKTLRQAVSPEEGLGVDSSVSSFASVTDVVVSGDLDVAKVYISVYGDERGQKMAMDGLKKLQGFFYDDSYERAGQVMKVIHRLKEERESGVSALDPAVSLDELLKGSR